MTQTRKIMILPTLLAFSFLALAACTTRSPVQIEKVQASPTIRDVPTWTPRTGASTLPAVTKPAPVSKTSTPGNSDPKEEPTPKSQQVVFSVSGGNLNIRRGPGLAYNYVSVLYDGDSAQVLGRDRISRWLMIALPGNPEARGWVTTETKYSTITGEVSSLPFVEVEPALPAFIRNCTNKKILILPDYVQLLPKYERPYNEDRFDVKTYEVYDLDTPGDIFLGTISLFEGKTVDILYDGTGEKSKCE